MELTILTRLLYLVIAVLLIGFVAVLGVAVARLWIQDNAHKIRQSTPRIKRDSIGCHKL
ncbi:hypothetical protein D3C87_1281750 [compost metagenome]